MSDIPLDTNVIVRYLTESPQHVDAEFEGVFGFFEELAIGNLSVFLPDLVLFQSYFVLTSFYKAPRSESADKLRRIVEFPGIQMAEKNVIIACLRRLQSQNLDVVDCYLLAWAESRGVKCVYSFDRDLEKNGLELLKLK